MVWLMGHGEEAGHLSIRSLVQFMVSEVQPCAWHRETLELCWGRKPSLSTRQTDDK